MPITLILLLVVFGALIAAGIPVLLARHRGDRGDLAAGHRQPLAADRPAPPSRSCCSSAWRSASTTRCSTCAASARSGRRAGRRRGAADRGGAPRAGPSWCPALTVMIALAGLFLTGDRRVHRRGASARSSWSAWRSLGSLTVLPALLAWLGAAGRRGPDPVPRPAPRRGPAVAAVGSAGPPGGAPAADLGRRRRGRAARAGRARARPAAGRARPSTRRTDAAVVQTMAEAIQRAFPQAPAPAEVVVTGTDVDRRRRVRSRGRRAAGPVRRRGGAIREPVDHHRVRRRAAALVGRRAAGGQRGRRRVRQRAADAARPGPAGDARQGAGVSYAVAGRHRGQPRRHPRRLDAPLPAGVRASSLGLAFLLLMVAFRSVAIPADVDRAEPAVGRRRLRPDDADLPGRPAAGAARLHRVRRDHLRGCRCSCSCSCSGSAWTTTCSSSAGSASCGRAARPPQDAVVGGIASAPAW